MFRACFPAALLLLILSAHAPAQEQYIQSWTVLSDCGARPQGTLPNLFFDSMWDQNCVQRFKASNSSAPLWDLVSINAPGNGGWNHPLDALRPAIIDAGCSAGMPAIDPSGRYLLFIYQPNRLCD